jgi:hypothetical protein
MVVKNLTHTKLALIGGVLIVCGFLFPAGRMKNLFFLFGWAALAVANFWVICGDRNDDSNKNR